MPKKKKKINSKENGDTIKYEASSNGSTAAVNGHGHGDLGERLKAEWLMYYPINLLSKQMVFFTYI